MPFGAALVGALVVEGAWEILENTDMVIQRYRDSTIALDYYGRQRSQLGLRHPRHGGRLRAGAGLARLARRVARGSRMEVVVGFWIRDNLTLNIIMLIFPIDAIKLWQSSS